MKIEITPYSSKPLTFSDIKRTNGTWFEFHDDLIGGREIHRTVQLLGQGRFYVMTASGAVLEAFDSPAHDYRPVIIYDAVLTLTRRKL